MFMEKYYFITGAASGIGEATALKLASPNVTLILHTRKNSIGLNKVAQKCQQQGAKTHLLFADLTKSHDTSLCIDEIKQHIPHINGIICNAGFPDWRGFQTLDSHDFQTSINSIINANFTLLNELTPLLEQAKHSAVVTVSSFLSHKFQIGDAFMPASAAAKSGLEALTKSFAAQFASLGITANIVCPGYIKKNSPEHVPLSEGSLAKITERIPQNRLGDPAEVAELIDFLLSSKARYITGQCIHIDGGLLLK